MTFGGMKLDARGTALAFWAAKITTSYCDIIAGIIEGCELLSRAKASVRHGAWIGLCRQLGVSRFKAARRLRIAKHARLTDRLNFRHLPADENVLWELAQLSLAEFDVAMERGEITPDLRRADVIHLRRRANSAVIAACPSVIPTRSAPTSSLDSREIPLERSKRA
ncbi:MAG: hypothetical protein ABL957_10690 [Parvularculaceae bacterium]